MNLKDFLEDCKDERIIDQATADRMYAHFLRRNEQATQHSQTYLRKNQSSKNNGLIITVSILGVLLIGFGIIYLFAHNWDHLSRSMKTFLSMTPVIIAIGVNLFTLLKRKDNVIWQESAAIYSFLAVGSMLALIMQVYQLQGIENYFFTYWCMLCLPLVYLLQSHSAVFCAMLLIVLNLTSSPLDQSSLIRIPWFGSLLMFGALVPYLKRLFSLRAPESLYQAHQIVAPMVVFLSAIASIQGTHAMIWSIVFLLLVNFHLFGSSIYLRRTDRKPNLMSIVSYIGLNLSLTYLLFNPTWEFDRINLHVVSDERLYFIPVLFLLAVVQLVHFFSKEKPSVDNAYKWVLCLPLPFVIANYFGFNAFSAYQLTVLIIGLVVVYFAQQSKDPWKVYPSMSILTVLTFSLTFFTGNSLSFFLIALIPSIYYLIPIVLLKEEDQQAVKSDQIVILAFQIVILLTASFQGFWLSIKQFTEPLSSFELILLLLLVSGLTLLTLKNFALFKRHHHGYIALSSVGVPALIWIGCISPIGLQHMYSIILLLLGVIALILSAKKSNLTIANLSLALIGIVIICRFLDLKMSLTVKGILFIFLGASFFFANYLILKSKKHENHP